jgi:hypothetical protein
VSPEYRQQAQTQSDDDKCKDKSSSSPITSNHTAGMMHIGMLRQ